MNISYKYNDAGIRTEKTVNGDITKYHLVGDDVTYEENGTDKIYYSYDSTDHLVSMNLNGEEYYYVRNAQGDIIGLLDSTGVQVVTYAYDSWGKLISIKDQNGADVTNVITHVGYKNPYRYRGYRLDTETGLYYLQSRYYNPEWGRFINMDSLGGRMGELLSHNAFAYCTNNPVNLIDPDGHCAILALGFANPITLLGVGIILGIVYLGAMAIDSYNRAHISYADTTSTHTSPDSRNRSTNDNPPHGSESSGGGDGGNPEPPEKPKKPHKHHVYPKAIGGAAAQKLVQMAPEIHRKLHSLVYKFEGGWLAPKRGYKGDLIQRLYEREAIEDGLIRFYSSYEEFKDLVEPLKEAIKFTMGNK